jgi:hypothetical protein
MRIEQESVMNMYKFLGGTRRVLAVIPMMVVLLTGTTSTMAQVVAAVPTKSIVKILVTGTVPGTPEAVTFTNAAVQIGSTLARDPDPTLPPVLIVDITFLKASGVGATTKSTYVAEAQVTKVRPLAARDVIEITFPFAVSTATTLAAVSTTSSLATAPTVAAPTATRDAAIALSTKTAAEARAGLATLTLTFDTNGVITGATGAIGANIF